MNPTVMGTINGVFSREVAEKDMDVAMLQTGFLMDDMVTDKAYVLVRNTYGKWTVVKMDDWNINLDGVYDEDGVLVE